MSEGAPCNHPGDHLHDPVAPATLERAARLLRAAGDPGRLKLLELLSYGEHCVSELSAECGDSLPTISQRLRVLRSEGLVSRTRDGKHQNYRLADDHVRDILRAVLDHAGEVPKEA